MVENYKFSKQNFKDALDDELLELYPLILSCLGCDNGEDAEEVLKSKPTLPVIRELKQKHGTEVRRAQDEEYWVKKWIETYTKTFNENVCVDDVRFLNEVDAIKRFGGIIVRIERTDECGESSHVSETALDDYEADFNIVADPGDMVMIQMSLDKIIEIENDIGNREEDSDHSGANVEYLKEASKEGR